MLLAWYPFETSFWSRNPASKWNKNRITLDVGGGTCFVNCIEKRERDFNGDCEWKSEWMMKFIASRVNESIWNFSIINIEMKAFPKWVALDSQTSLLKEKLNQKMTKHFCYWSCLLRTFRFINSYLQNSQHLHLDLNHMASERNVLASFGFLASARWHSFNWKQSTKTRVEGSVQALYFRVESQVWNFIWTNFHLVVSLFCGKFKSHD